MSDNENSSETTEFQGTVSEWVCNLKTGDAEAAQALWNRYFDKIVAHANRRIRSHDCPKGSVEPEDVAASVFESLWKGANAGRFRNVIDRGELWWLLLTMTRRKVVSHIRHAMAEKRFPGHSPTSLNKGNPADLFHELVSHEPNASDVLILEEQYSYLLGLLRDEKLRQIAVLRVEGYLTEEICAQTNLSSATVTRKLKLIRQTWLQAFRDEGVDNGIA